jgi:hypothetical protein
VALMRFDGKRTLATLGFVALTVSLGVAIHGFNLMLQDVDSIATESQRFVGDIGRRLAWIGLAALVSSLVALLFLSAGSRDDHRLSTFLAVAALLACLGGEAALTPPLYDLGPEMAAIEAFEPPLEAVESGATFKEPSEHPEMSRSWMVRGSSDEVVELTRLSLESWADDGSVEKASELPSAFRAKRNGEFALMTIYEAGVDPGTRRVTLRVKRGRFPDV